MDIGNPASNISNNFKSLKLEKPIAVAIKNIEHKKTFATMGIAASIGLAETAHLLHKKRTSTARNGPQTKSNSSRGGIAYL